MVAVSRLQLDHPALGTTGGAGLHASIEAIYKKIGDNVSSRILTAVNLNDAATATVTHDLKCAFGEIRLDLFLYDETTTELTRITKTSTPSISQFTIAANGTNPTTQIDITNNSGAQRDLALVAILDPIELDELVDVEAPTPEDGQALVFDFAAQKWKPGASGDASFKIQGVTDPNATIKGGYMLLADGRELATWDGAGSASTDFGKDITINLDTILGFDPGNAMTYYLYLDLATLTAPVVLTDNGRKLYPITQANFMLTTNTPDTMNRSRYVPRGAIRSATSGTVWSGAGAAFATLAFLKGELPPVAVSPLVFSQSQTLIADLGTAGQIRQGHVLTAKSFKSSIATDNTKLAYWNLASNSTDKVGLPAHDLTNVNTIPFTGSNILGTANAAASLTGASSQRFTNSDSFFQPNGAGGFAVGMWIKPTSVSVDQGICSRYVSAGNLRQWLIRITSTGKIQWLCSTDGTAATAIEIATVDVAGLAGKWMHIGLIWTGSELRPTFNGKPVASVSFTTFANVAPVFEIGSNDAANYFTGLIEDAFYVKGNIFADHDLAIVTATKIDHNKALPAERQQWSLNHWAAGVAPVTPLENAILDQSDSNSVFLDLSQADPTDKIDIRLFDTGAAGAVSIPVQTAEFTFSATGQLTTSTTSFPTNLVEDVRSLQGWQKTTNGWEPLDLVGLVWVTATGAKHLQGNLDGLPVPPSPTNPVRIIVASTASAQAVGRQTATNLVGLVDGSRPGGGVYLKRPDGVIREIALDNADNIVVLDT